MTLLLKLSKNVDILFVYSEICLILSSETVKDLIRFLKRDDETCDIRRQLGEACILQKDIVPILKQYYSDRVLLEAVIRCNFRAIHYIYYLL